MTWSFSLGRLFGSEIRVHATFFLLLLWVGAAAFSEGGWPAVVENLLFVIALFACVVAHEFGHALTARRFGIRTPDIALLPIGGMARLEKMPDRPRHEVIVALAGPAVSIAIWAILTVLSGAETRLDTLTNIDSPTGGFVGRLAMINLFLALFNLLPAFPMDGGRVFRALLEMRMDRVRATRIAAGAGQILAFVLGALGLMSGNLILLLIAFFVFIAGTAESNDVALRAAARTLMAREAMITQFETLAPNDRLQVAANALIRTTQHEFPVVMPDGALVGFLGRSALLSAMQEDTGPMRAVNMVMETDVPRVTLTESLDHVLDAMHGGADVVAVCTADGRLLGYVSRENLGELMILQGRRGA